MKRIKSYGVIFLVAFIFFSGSGFTATGSVYALQQVDLRIETYENDGKNFVKATLKLLTDDGEKKPVVGEELLFDVERMFGLLPVSEFDFTDERGEVTVQYPNDLPGDKNGNIVVVVRLLDNPGHGELVVRESVAWGQPTGIGYAAKDQGFGLKSSPLNTIIYLSGLFLIWGIILYGLFFLFKINDINLEA